MKDYKSMSKDERREAFAKASAVVTTGIGVPLSIAMASKATIIVAGKTAAAGAISTQTMVLASGEKIIFSKVAGTLLYKGLALTCGLALTGCAAYLAYQIIKPKK